MPCIERMPHSLLSVIREIKNHADYTSKFDPELRRNFEIGTNNYQYMGRPGYCSYIRAMWKYLMFGIDSNGYRFAEKREEYDKWVEQWTRADLFYC